MKLSQELRQARLNITGEGHWVTGALHTTTEHNTDAYCSIGAFKEIENEVFCKGVTALFVVLQRRYFAGELPKPVKSGGNNTPFKWDFLFNLKSSFREQMVIAQFNNSTSQADVLDLFDEAIAEVEAKERAEETNSTKIIDLTPEMEHASA